MLRKIKVPFIPLPESAKDCYSLAKELNITPAQAAEKMKRENWQFVGYTSCGEEAYVKGN